MVMQYNDLATICKELDKPEKAKRYQQKAKAIANRINRWMWNEKDGLYYDVDPEGNQVKWKTAACFWPMLANITSKSQEEKLVGNLKDTASFWRPMIFPSLAADQKYYSPKGRYWHGSVWAPTNYIIIKGLQQQGYEDFAQIATKKYLDGLAKVFNTTGTLWECYAPDSFEPATVAEKDKLVRKDFVGWTGCGPIALLIENILGFRVDGVRKNITWHLTQSDKHGIQNLPCGDASVNLTAEPSPGEKNKYKIVVKPNAPITLTLVHPLKGNKKFNLKAEERVIYW
jgi:glycogen debranching enzyme